MKFVLWVGILIPLFSGATTITETFNTNSRKATSTLIWNIGLGRLHPTVTVSNWQSFVGAPTSTSLDFGDGSNGSFDSTTLANFDSDPSTPKVIDLDTSIYPVLQVTNFILPDTYTLKPFGNNPLIIRSLNDVRVIGAGLTGGTIDCSGGSGRDTRQPETLSSVGGTGRCGGRNGGNGGFFNGANVASERGFLQSGVANPVGGAGGALGTFGGGGGGSLFNQSNPDPGLDGAGAPVGGTEGTNYDDQEFSSLIGGAGGGGGGMYKLGGGTDSSGAGGGAGGGVVIIYAFHDFYCEGNVRANGGDGGGDGGVTLGGLGGGGGGGTVIIIAGHDYINDGQVYVAPGNGGSRLSTFGDGGVGGPGRAWYTDNNNTLGGGGSEDTSCILNNCGTVNFDLGTLEATTSSIDLQNSRPALTNFNVTSVVNGASTVTVSIAGSKDNFSSDNTGWVSTASLSAVSKKRYIKFRFQINNQDATNYSYVDDLTLNYSETTQDDFPFGAACGRIENPGSPTIWKFLFQALAPLFPYLFVRAYQLRPKKIFGKNSCS